MDWSRRLAFRASIPQGRQEPVYEERGSIFDLRGGDRELRVVLSTEVESSSPSPRRALALGLIAAGNVELLRYSDDGPPDDAESVDSVPGGSAFEGWLTVTLTPDNYMSSMGSCTYVTPDAIHGSGLGGADGVNLALGHDSRNGAPAPDFMGSPAGRAAVALRAALGARADLLLTDREDLLPPHRYLGGATVEVMRPEDALPLLGLYLRSRGRFLVDVNERQTYTIESPLFWHYSVFSLAPRLETAWRGAGGAQDLTFPVARGLRGVVARLALALEARDRVHRACLVHPHAKPAREAASAYDYLMLSVGAALDSVAKLVHHILGVPGPDDRVSWTRDHKGSSSRRPDWLRELGQVEGGARVRAVAKRADHVHFHRIFGELRNSIHGAAPESLPASDDHLAHYADRTLVRLHVRNREQLIESCSRLRGPDYWSVWPLQDPEGSGTVVDPAVTGDLLIKHAIAFIDEVVDLVQPSATPAGEPIVDEAVSERLRWLIGLHAPSET